MSLTRIFSISATALSAQSQRLNVVASNLANADAVAGPDGAPYKARQVVFQAQQPASGVSGVRVTGIVEDNAPARRNSSSSPTTANIPSPTSSRPSNG